MRHNRRKLAFGITLALVLLLALGAGTLYAGGATPTATGSVHFLSGGAIRTFAFTAVTNDDGSADGQWQLVTRAGGGLTTIHGTVNCVTTSGNQAWVGTTITSSNNPLAIIGSEGGFRVVDNGQGDSAVDEASVVFVNAGAGFAAEYCAGQPEAPPLNPIIAGNAWVR